MRGFRFRLVLLSCLLLTAATSRAVPSVLVKVFDPGGKPSPQFEARAFFEGSAWGSWQEYTAGRLRLEGNLERELGGKVPVWIHAAGYAAQSEVVPVTDGGAGLYGAVKPWCAVSVHCHGLGWGAHS